MHLRPLFAALLLLGAADLPAVATPVGLKELDLLVRVRTPEREILAEVAERHLLDPIDAAAERQLTADGASAALIARLKAGNFVAAPSVAKALRVPPAPAPAAPPPAAPPEPPSAPPPPSTPARESAPTSPAPSAPAAAPTASADTMQRFFDGKLVQLKDSRLQPVSAADLHSVHYFVLYYATGASSTCREFTPSLVDFYKKAKPAHPEFEIVYVSVDRDAAAMESSMKSAGIPWPAVRFDKIDASFKPFFTSSIPWLLILDGNEEAVFPKNPNLAKKYPDEWTNPIVTLQALDTLLKTGEAAARPAP